MIRFFDYAYNKMAEQKSPFFTYVITMSSLTCLFTNVWQATYNNSDYDSIQDENCKELFSIQCLM